MANDKVDTIGFRRENYPEVLEVANRLAELEQRKPHDSIRLLILGAGRKKIEEIEASLPADSRANEHNSLESIKAGQQSQELNPPD